MSAGQSLISVLIAILVIAMIAVGILGLSILTTRLLVGAERHVAALAILNERKEFIEALPYHDVGFVTPGMGEPAGVIDVGTESVSLNNQTYRLSTTIQYIDDPLAAGANDYKRVELLVEWETPSGTTRDAHVVTYISEKSEPKSCVSCPDSRGCDETTGICNPPVPLPPAPIGPPCTPGLLCDNGTLCPLAGLCPDVGATVPPVDPQGEACVLGEVCSNGALCPLSGVCPTASCPDWTCPAQNVCFGGFCYPEGWYDITFSSDDNTGPADSSPMVCEQDQCETSLDCPSDCQSDCQYIDSGAFTGCGRWRVVQQCQSGWVPECRKASGGASSSCRGGYDVSGVCSGLECDPVPCPLPDPLVDPGRSWCANGKECHISSSNTGCSTDSDCPTGELCGLSGACRTICPGDAGCGYYWGGWARGCSVEVVAEGSAGCTDNGSSCTGPAGDCNFADPPTSIGVRIDNVDPADYNLVLADPVEVPEGGLSSTSPVAFRVSLSQAVADTLTVRMELQDGSATEADSDYSGTDVTLTFEPGDPLNQVILAQVIGDVKDEDNEDFQAALVEARSNAHDVRIDIATATVLIVDDDPQPINFNDYTIESYGGGQDVSGTVTVEDSGLTLHMVGNLWKKIGFPYELTANTMLEFDFRSTAQGEIHGIGFDVDDGISAEYTFKVYGVQAWGIADYADYGGSAPGWKHYTIPVGQYYTASMNYLIFVMDHDVAPNNGENYFRNVMVYEPG